MPQRIMTLTEEEVKQAISDYASVHGLGAPVESVELSDGFTAVVKSEWVDRINLDVKEGFVKGDFLRWSSGDEHTETRQAWAKVTPRRIQIVIPEQEGFRLPEPANFGDPESPEYESHDCDYMGCGWEHIMSRVVFHFLPVKEDTLEGATGPKIETFNRDGEQAW